MTREEAKQLASVMQAYAEGKEVQRLSTGGIWTDIPDPIFDSYDEWRVKPEPTKLREWWLIQSTNQSA